MLFSFFLALCQTFSLPHAFALPLSSSDKAPAYDFIIIGGGTAGLTLASRLSENPELQVAVIEAGGYYEHSDGNNSIVPGYASYGTGIDPATANSTPSIDWGFVTAPIASLDGRTMHYARGKTLGGCSARNDMMGTAQAYDLWAELVGDESYEFENMLPYFRKSVHYSPPNTALRAANASVPDPSGEAYSPEGGPLKVSHSNWGIPMSSYAGDAFASIGIPPVQDFSSGYLLGAQYAPTTISPPNEERSSSQTSFLEAASGRTNLKVFTYTLAKRILFDNENRAIGVEVQSANNTFSLNASKEVILSAGAFQSPQLLMVSGIGPKATLENLGIPVIVDRESVGQNMWDQFFFPLFQEADFETQSGLSSPTAAATAAELYNANRTGILTSNGGDFFGWEKLPPASRANLSTAALADLATFPPDWPENELIISTLANPVGVVGQNYALVVGGLMTPLSRGNVTIISSDTSDLSVFNPNYLLSTTDQEVAVQMFRRARALLNSPAFASILIGEESVPGIAVQTDAEILAFLKTAVSPSYHPACSCAMGQTSDPAAVVDSKAQVIGVQGLRVVDASSFPLLPPGHPQATVYAFAEKIAADILNCL